jgi:serine/threonine protein kinase
MVARLCAARRFTKHTLASLLIRRQMLDGLVLTLAYGSCEGGDLHNKIKEKMYFSISQKLNMLAGVASGIAYLHSLPMVHRDLSSRNLLLTSSGDVKICDFGCARILKDFSHHPSFISGSPPWMAPEQVRLHVPDLNWFRV